MPLPNQRFASMPGAAGGGQPASTMPSWLMPLMASAPPTMSSRRPDSFYAQPQAAPAPAPLSQAARMAQNTARGTALKAANVTHGDASGIGVETLHEGVPMAGRLGSARGPLTAQGVGMSAGGGGGQATPAPATLNGSSQVGQQLQSAMDKANKANEQRYQQLLGLTGQLSNAATTREDQREASDMGRVDQNAISAGIGNTTVLPSLERGVSDDSAIRRQEIDDQGIKSAMGVIERRTDSGPDYGAIAALAARPGAVGGVTQPNYGGGGYGGGGGVAAPSAGSAGYGSSFNPYAALLQQPAATQATGDGFTSSNNNGWGHQIPAAPAPQGVGYNIGFLGDDGSMNSAGRVGGYNAGTGGTPVNVGDQDVGYGYGKVRDPALDALAAAYGF